MPVLRSDERLAGEWPAPQGRFTGPARQRPLHTREGDTVRVSFVRFEPGARTHWHSHSGGQVIHVVEGEVGYQERGGEPETLLPGDTATAGPGAEHWHGSGGPAAVHLAVTIGDVSWAEGPL